MGQGAHPVLEEGERLGRQARREDRLRGPPRLHRAQPRDIVRLREAAGSNLGANLDPSHFFWQGIDPVEAARFLGEHGCIFHVHAKDSAIDPRNSRIIGNLDTKSYGDFTKRSWVFRTVGYGHGDEFWKPFVSMLRLQGYDGVLSIEHEDSLMSMNEGFEKAVAYLRGRDAVQTDGQGVVVLRRVIDPGQLFRYPGESRG